MTWRGNNPFWPVDRGGGTDTQMVSPRVDCGALCAGERATPLGWFLKVIDFSELNSRGWRTRLGKQKEQGWESKAPEHGEEEPGQSVGAPTVLWTGSI